MKRRSKEVREITESNEAAAMRGSVSVPAGLNVTQYHVAPYKRLCLFAELIGLTEPASLTKATEKRVRNSQ